VGKFSKLILNAFILDFLLAKMDAMETFVKKTFEDPTMGEYKKMQQGYERYTFEDSLQTGQL
jgi:hypothetical protein